MRADVVVVGAGIVGLAVAAYLQDEGRSVLVVDRGEPAKGASYGNAGAFAFSDVLPMASPGMLRRAPGWLLDPLGPLSIPPSYLPRVLPWLVRFWRASRPDRARASLLAQSRLMGLAASEMRVLLARTGTGGMVRSDGTLELYEGEAELKASGAGWRARAEHGIAFEHVRGDRLAELQPGLDRRFVAGTFVPAWQTVADPYRFALKIAEHVTARGGHIVRREVLRVLPAEDGVRVTLAERANGDEIDARQAVIAAGAWSKRLASALGDDVPLETERGYNTTLPPGAFDLRRQLTFGGHGFVVTPLSTGIRIGGAVELAGLDRPPNFARSEAMLRKAKQFMPALKTGNGRQWMGFRPSLPDTRPVIGFSSASPAIVYAFGHGHLGLTQCAATGRLVADLLGGRPPPIAIEPFSPKRF